MTWRAGYPPMPTPKDRPAPKGDDSYEAKITVTTCLLAVVDGKLAYVRWPR